MRATLADLPLMSLGQPLVHLGHAAQAIAHPQLPLHQARLRGDPPHAAFDIAGSGAPLVCTLPDIVAVSREVRGA